MSDAADEGSLEATLAPTGLIEAAPATAAPFAPDGNLSDGGQEAQHAEPSTATFRQKVAGYNGPDATAPNNEHVSLAALARNVISQNTHETDMTTAPAGPTGIVDAPAKQVDEQWFQGEAETQLGGSRPPGD